MSSRSSYQSRRQFLKAKSSLLVLSVFTAVARPRIAFADPIPAGLSPELVRKITIDNPRATYSRLLEPVR